MNEPIINYGLEFYRGSIKQLMKVKHLRQINFKNFVENYAKDEENTKLLRELNLHSVKYDVMTGYIDLYRQSKGKQSGEIIMDAPIELYKIAFLLMTDILRVEKEIPYKMRRSILVGVYR
jgi:hypothetical protein